MVHPSNHPNQSSHRVLLHADLPRPPIPTTVSGNHRLLLSVHDIDIHHGDTVLYSGGGRLVKLERRVYRSMLRQ